MSIAQKIREEFDEKIHTVKKRGVEVPFSSDIILSSLIDSGITPLHAIDILFMIKDKLQANISTKKILKYLNESIHQLGYDENSFVKSETTIPIMIEYKGSKVELSFKVIKELVRERMKNMRYTSKTFRDLVDELHRAVLALENWDLTVEDVERLIPLALRNIVGTNPFSKDRSQIDYQIVNKLKMSIEKTWVALPTEERYYMLVKFFEASYRVILLSFDFIPGHIVNSSLVQINNLITYLTSKGDNTLSDTEIKTLSNNAVKLGELFKMQESNISLDYKVWEDDINIIASICDGLMSNNSIKWIVGRDNYGRDIFTFSSKQYIDEGGKSTLLISSAIYGIEAQINEITRSKVELIDQGDNAILISKKELFAIISLVEKPVSHLIRQKLRELGDFIEQNFSEEIKKFKGKVSVFQNALDPYLKENLSTIFTME